MPEQTEQTEKLGLSVQFDALTESTLSKAGLEASEFNEYGVRELDDGSIDVAFGAMTPGIRNGARITADFLDNVASKDYHSLPVQMDHDKSQRMNAGRINFNAPMDGLWFDSDDGEDGQLNLFVHVPNTGNSLRSDVISDFTHEPPAIRDGSIGLDPSSIEFELPDGFDSLFDWKMAKAMGEDPDPVEFIDARMREFSLVTMPGGYDPENAGVGAAAFSTDFAEQYDARNDVSTSYDASDESDGGRAAGQARVRPTERSLPLSVTTHTGSETDD